MNISLRPVDTLDGVSCIQSLVLYSPYALRAYLIAWQKDGERHTQRFPEAIFSEINKTLIKFIELIKVVFLFPDLLILPENYSQ